MSETRVVLIKPGDVLLIGNVSLGDPERAGQVLRDLKDVLGLRQIAVFEDDIDIAAYEESK